MSPFTGGGDPTNGISWIELHALQLAAIHATVQGRGERVIVITQPTDKLDVVVEFGNGTRAVFDRYGERL